MLFRTNGASFIRKAAMILLCLALHTASETSNPSRMIRHHHGQTPLRVAVVGAGPSGVSAVRYLKTMTRAGDYNVTLFDANSHVGGVMKSMKWGKDQDGKEGVVNGGLVVTTRFFYPNYYEFLDAEGLKTRRKPMTLNTGYDQPPKDPHFKASFKEFYRELLNYPGTFDVFAHEFRHSSNVATQWFINKNLEMTVANLAFMTVDFGTRTDHAAGCLSFLNMTGDGTYEVPVDGFGKSAEVAAAYANRVLTGVQVTSVEPHNNGPAKITWKEPAKDGKIVTEAFDAVILTIPPSGLRQAVQLAKDKLDLLPDDDAEHSHKICVHHNTEIVRNRTDVAFYEFRHGAEIDLMMHRRKEFIVNTFPNGARPPFVTFFRPSCDEECRREYIPAEYIIEEYDHSTFVHQGEVERSRSAAFLRQMSGLGGLHYAGVWTADGRFAEGTWVSGMRAAMEVAKKDYRDHPFKSHCSKRSFRRYGLWFQDDSSENLGAVPTDCFRISGEIPAYFDSLEEYDAFLKQP